MFEQNERKLHFHDLVSETHFQIGEFETITFVAWYKGDVVALSRDKPIVRRASYMDLFESPNIRTFEVFSVPQCTGRADIQLSQYTGKVLYSSDCMLVILNLETMKATETDIEGWYTVNTGCILPEGMVGLMSRNEQPFFVDSCGREARVANARFLCYEVIPSSSDLCDLSRALVRESNWHVPGKREVVASDGFKERTGWNGYRLVRVVGDVFLFRESRKEYGEWVHGWYAIRVFVP